MNLVEYSDAEILDEVRRRWPRHVFPPIPEVKVVKAKRFLSNDPEANAQEMDRGPVDVVNDEGKVIMSIRGQYRPIPCDCLCEPCQLCRDRYEEEDDVDVDA